MLQAKTFELRDRNTFIPIVGVLCDPGLLEPTEADIYLLRRAGYGNDFPCVLLTRLDRDGGKACYDCYTWGDRTFETAHDYIQRNWHDMKSGDVIDVEFILGETHQPKTSERETCLL